MVKQSASLASEATAKSVEGDGLWGTVVAPLALLLPCPVLCFVLAYMTSDEANKSGHQTCVGFGTAIYEDPAKIFGDVFQLGSFDAWIFLLAFNFLSLVLYWYPGKTEYGPITIHGHKPEYIDNGAPHCFLFTALFIAGSDIGIFGWYKITVIWDNFPETIGALNIFGLLFCLLLYFKGLNFPSGLDAGSSGKGFIFDYYWGTELYPRFFNIDVKKFVNDRFSMTYWMVAGISFFYAAMAKHKGSWDWGLFYCALSQFIYLCKFFWWEIGYMRSIDIIVDRAGFYETWGCLVWVPAVYTLHTRVLVNTPSGLDFNTATAIFFVGTVLGVGCNFWADSQKQWFRASDGQCLIWGQKPKFVACKYTAPDSRTGKMETRDSLLLASGFWGVARHFQYLFELIAAWSWGLLAGYSGEAGFLPFFYPVFLTILLIHRAKRDQEKCLAKYGDGYRKYMELVPYKILPYVY